MSDGEINVQMSTTTLANGSDSPPKSKFSKRTLIKTILSRPDGGVGFSGQKVTVGGWVKTGREQGKGSFAFLELNDGSCPSNLQVIVDTSVADIGQLVQTGTCVLVEGELKKPPEGTKQNVELRVERVVEVGPVDPAKYPLPKTKLKLEFLRDQVHLRAKTNTETEGAMNFFELNGPYFNDGVISKTFFDDSLVQGFKSSRWNRRDRELVTGGYITPIITETNKSII
ncbi:hypothetical protein GIB67_001112 [Kingdonia uniflora]|uniref:OB domain-containing protein n=1 Tax=Kingdonia uniflora TaxID=39325 RepID=A0A7J7MG31_9MAGN|nr:hypothetical protein GIB67_001112 [Kingdonia uniflora]